MNILVCFTIGPDVEKLSGEDWLVENGLGIDTSFLKPVLNNYDESALEIALTLSEDSRAAQVPILLTAITISGKEATPILRTLNALPFDRIVRIDNQTDLCFKPLAAAASLNQYVRKHAQQDVLLLGQQSSVSQNAKTHLLAAEMLGWPCITRVVQIEAVDSKHLMVTSQVDDGQVQLQIKTPCVLSIGDAPNTYLRVPTLKDRMHLGRRSMTVLPLDSFDLPKETEVLTNLEVIQHRRSSILLGGRNPEETAQKLFDEHLKGSLLSKTELGRR